MKKSILITAFLLISLFNYSQNYRPYTLKFQIGGVTHYYDTRSIEGIHIDASGQELIHENGTDWVSLTDLDTVFVYREIAMPSVTLCNVNNITPSSAVALAEVTDDGGAIVTERGMCWSADHSPTIDDAHANSGNGIGLYVVTMGGLTSNTTYYARAYAINSAGTSYSNEMSFTTTQVQYGVISVSAYPNEGGEVGGGGVYEYNHACTVTATANEGYLFTHWTEYGQMASSSPNYTFIVHGNRNLIANFVNNSQNCTISVSANPSNGGTLTGGGQYQQGQICTVSAVANSHYVFQYWSEGNQVVSTDAEYSFTVNGNRTLVAHFYHDGSGSHEYVDLGLPSGLLWATCNVGAAFPEDYGAYFAWAETQPKDDYSWSNYVYCCHGNSLSLTKYCNNYGYGCDGYTDNLTILEPGDDAATANWGNGWRTPTKAEWQELFDNCSSVWTTQNGVNGRLYTGPNGNTLFLPAAGSDHGFLAGSSGFYRTSMLLGADPSGTWNAWSGENGYEMFYNGRSEGISVRAVRSAKQQ